MYLCALCVFGVFALLCEHTHNTIYFMISHRMNATTLNQNTIKFIPFAVEKIYDNNTQRQAAGHMKTTTEWKFKCTYSERVGCCYASQHITTTTRTRAIPFRVHVYFYSLSDTSRTLYKSAYNFNVALKFLALIFFALSRSFSPCVCLFITVSVKGQASVRPCSNLCLTSSLNLLLTLCLTSFASSRQWYRIVIYMH